MADHQQAIEALDMATKDKGSAVDGRTKRGKNYAISMIKCKRIEECFGWAKTVSVFRKTSFIGTAKVQAQVLRGTLRG